MQYGLDHFERLTTDYLNDAVAPRIQLSDLDCWKLAKIILSSLYYYAICKQYIFMCLHWNLPYSVAYVSHTHQAYNARASSMYSIRYSTEKTFFLCDCLILQLSTDDAILEVNT
jgi:hypothetical protein